MASEPQPTAPGYLHGILADGARPFDYRSGVRALLGLPDGEVGIALVTPSLLPLRRRQLKAINDDDSAVSATTQERVPASDAPRFIPSDSARAMSEAPIPPDPPRAPANREMQAAVALPLPDNAELPASSEQGPATPISTMTIPGITRRRAPMGASADAAGDGRQISSVVAPASRAAEPGAGAPPPNGERRASSPQDGLARTVAAPLTHLDRQPVPATRPAGLTLADTGTANTDALRHADASTGVARAAIDTAPSSVLRTSSVDRFGGEVAPQDEFPTFEHPPVGARPALHRSSPKSALTPVPAATRTLASPTPVAGLPNLSVGRRIEQLRGVVSDLASQLAEYQRHRAVPEPPRAPITSQLGARRAAQPAQLGQVFWERRYLGRSRLRKLR